MAVIDTLSGSAILPSSDSAAFDFLAEANHRIANHLSMLAGMVQLRAAAVGRGPEILDRGEVRGMLRETAGRIVSVGNLHRKMAHVANGENIDLGNYLIGNSMEVISTLALSDRVGVVERIEKDCFISPDRAALVGLIVSEIIMNAIKHAHPSGVPIQISLGCGKTSDGGILVDVSDDGVGLPEGFDPATQGGLGFRLIRSLAEKLGAALRTESDSLGLCFQLKLPAGA
ncbi:MAG TPA: sensor histidine kinase [Rhizomicrobium sp.]|nr:sensor histidine kinase [Rhizomicrobium sp.]